ncbi:hypothetical protein AWL63_15035 [Sphingomonas panacis]|uniref:Uncharacterized protein n=2 Tax=Sphingomonas panacis TaxID=1560345 RepID=A0A1B3ZCC0_9SPHN|nr:hypothetical protein AWL63_15035 [Sphingomonas panacis]
MMMMMMMSLRRYSVVNASGLTVKHTRGPHPALQPHMGHPRPAPTSNTTRDDDPAHAEVPAVPTRGYDKMSPIAAAAQRDGVAAAEIFGMVIGINDW